MDPARRVTFGARRPIAPTLSRDETIQLRYEKLSRLLNRRTVVAFVGAGMSRARGYLTWREWVADLLQTTISDPAVATAAFAEGARDLRALGARLSAGGAVSADVLMYALGECKRVLPPARYEAVVRDAFRVDPGERARRSIRSGR